MQEETEATQLSRKEYETYFDKGINYSRYLANMISEVESGVESENSHYIPLNLQRSQRIAKTVQLTDAVKQEIAALHHKISWLVISEHWCGDSAQTLPVMNAIAEASNGLIDLRIVYRDENPELMNAYLTNGGKAIPKLIQLDGKYNVTGIWGPRPNEAQRLVKELKADPATAATYSEKLHKWYADDKTASTQRDMVKLLKIEVAFCPDCMAG